MINSVSSMGLGMGGMNIHAMQQHRNHMFSKIDSNSDGGVDKTEFSELATKLSEDTGNTIDVDTVYSTYDEDGDGSLSDDELKNFIKDNAPPPPPRMQQAISAYGMNMGDDQTSSLLELINSLSSDADSSSGVTTDSSNNFLSTLFSNLSAMFSSGNISSLLSLQA